MNNVYERVLNVTTDLLRKNSKIKNRAVVFDLDDTIINTRSTSIHLVPMVGHIEFYDRIHEMVELVKRAKAMGYVIIIITARPPGTEFIAEENIKVKIPELFPLIDKIFASPIRMETDIEVFKRFKAVMRRNIELIDLKTLKQLNSWQVYSVDLQKSFTDTLNIILTIGDQPHDISYMSNYGILLPRPERNPDEAFLYKRTSKYHEEFLQTI